MTCPARSHRPDAAESDEPSLSEMTAEEIGRFTCDRNPDPGRFADQTAEPTALAGDDFSIVTLDELFDFVDAYASSESKTADQRARAATIEYNIETKRVPDNPDAIGDDFDGTTPGAFELAILDLIADRGLGARVTIQSFDHRSLWAVRSADGTIDLAALTRRGEVPDFDELVSKGATIWSPTHTVLNPTRIEQAHDAGLLVIPWTVNDPNDMVALLASGVDGLITDRPDLAPPPRS